LLADFNQETHCARHLRADYSGTVMLVGLGSDVMVTGLGGEVTVGGVEVVGDEVEDAPHPATSSTDPALD
jgi:hypothetical protein